MLKDWGGYICLNLFSLVIVFLMVLMGVAFLTLLERKILGYLQDRKGPNKVGMVGGLQPFSDALKLMSKELFLVFKSFFMMYYVTPMISMSLMFMCWFMVFIYTNVYFLNYSILLILIFLSMNSYMLMLMGWASNSIYSMIGMIRSISQVLSYEVMFILIILILMIMSESFTLIDFLKYQKNIWYIIMMWPIFYIFFVSALVELNRSPFDFIEGESELVSGFNVEYFSGGFTLIFLGEYGMIMFMGMLMVLLFLGDLNYLMKFVFIGVMCSMIIFMRGVLPRLRYDELMYMCWKVFLPMVLNFLICIISFKSILII